MEDHQINRLAILLLALCLCFVAACNYYKPIPTSPSAMSSAKSQEIASMSQKTIIIRSNEGDFLLKNMEIRMEKEDLLGILDSVPENNQTYITDTKQRFSYSSNDPSVLSEVHIYTSLEPNVQIGQEVIIPISNINKIEVIERDKQRSNTNTVLTVIGVTAGALAVALTVLVLSSCPFISAYDGQNYVLQGESFGGAIYPSLAREDFIPLPSLLMGNEIKLMIHNELKERQYTDFADLLLVSHSQNEHVLVQPNGELKIIKQKIKPFEASLNNQIDVLQKLSVNDNNFCNFNEFDDETAINQVIVGFDNPLGDQKLSLYLNLRNSYWLDHIFGEFISKFGSQHVNWVEKQRKRPAEELLEWRESQNIPLSISVKTREGWKEVQKLNTIGPLMNREVSVSLEGLQIEGPTVEIALTTGFMFWEIDQIALVTVEDVSPNSIQLLKPDQVLDENENNMLQPILDKDGVFLQQLESGNKAYITYKLDNYNPEVTYSAFLHTSGYYEPIRDFKGKTDKKFLTKFREPGTLPKFSKFKFLELTGDTYFGSN
jgi:hypothetical protein